jgi:hypothetical protein
VRSKVDGTRIMMMQGGLYDPDRGSVEDYCNAMSDFIDSNLDREQEALH